nr:DUF4917 family protein [Proteus mirabilis]
MKNYTFSNYLTRIYHEAIPTINDSLLILGWVIGTQDEHILKKFLLIKLGILGSWFYE